MPLLHLGKLGERRLIAKHAVDAFDDDQLAFALVGQARQTPVEIIRIVVAKTHHRRAAEPAAIVDARMRVGIHEDDIARAREAGQHAEIRLITSREYQRAPAIHELGDLALELAVNGVGTVGDARAGGPGAMLPGSGDGGIDTGGIKRKAKVVVGAHQNRVATVDPSASGGEDLGDAHAERVGAGLDDLAVTSRYQRVFVENVHELSGLRSVGAPPVANRPGFSSPIPSSSGCRCRTCPRFPLSDPWRRPSRY